MISIALIDSIGVWSSPRRGRVKETPSPCVVAVPGADGVGILFEALPSDHSYRKDQFSLLCKSAQMDFGMAATARYMQF